MAEIFQTLVQYSECLQQTWSRPKLGIRNFTQVFHTSGRSTSI